MNDKEREDLYHLYIGTNGGRYQAMKAVEECAELTAALMHFFSDRALTEEVITEIPTCRSCASSSPSCSARPRWSARSSASWNA